MITIKQRKHRRVWDEVYKILMQWSHLGIEDQSNGTKLIGHVPHVAPLAWLHSIYRKLDEDEINQLEQQIGHPLPEQYKEFLYCTNGLKTFSDSFSIFGLRRTLNRSPLAAREPYDLFSVTAQTLLDYPDYINIGSSRRGYRYYCKWRGDNPDEIFTCPQGQFDKVMNTWPDFWTMLEQEVKRLSALCDKKGRMKQ